MKIVFKFLSFILLPMGIHAQDVITTLKGDDISAKITEITTSEIIFIKDEKHYAISIAEVFMIRYENGSKDIFSENVTGKTSQGNDKSQRMYLQGLLDGEKIFPAKQGFSKGFASGFFVPKIGALFLPKHASENLVLNKRMISAYVLDPELKSDPDYMAGFAHGAKTKSLKRAVRGYTVGVVANTVVVYAFFLSLLIAL
jgi:hypothetical protein